MVSRSSESLRADAAWLLHNQNTMMNPSTSLYFLGTPKLRKQSLHLQVCPDNTMLHIKYDEQDL